MTRRHWHPVAFAFTSLFAEQGVVHHPLMA
jgi:hypothetical protein